MIKLIIFDYDGVIVDSFPTLFNVYKIIANRLGVAIPDDIEDFRKLYGYNYFECYKNLGLSPAQYQTAGKIFKAEIVKQKPKIFPDLKLMLDELSKFYQLVVVSYNFEQEVVAKLDNYKLSSYFTDIIAPKSIGDKTSKVEVIFNLLSKYKLSPNEVVYIGDRNIDYTVCRKAGIEKLILTNYGWGHSKDSYQYTVNKPMEIIDTIRKFNI